jgi:hypothetical protein
MEDPRLVEFERLCREADQKKDMGNKVAAFHLYAQAFDAVGWNGEPFRSLARRHSVRQDDTED